MINQKISELPALLGDNVADSDLLPIVDVSTPRTKKITASEFVAYTQNSEQNLTFDDVATLLAGGMTYTAGTIARTRKEGFSYQAVASGGGVTNAGGQQFTVLPNGFGVDLTAFGADAIGTTAIDAIWTAAVAAARSAGVGLYVPAGIYKVASGLDVISDPATSGRAMNFEIQGAGRNSTVFFSTSAPSYVLRIDARYVALRGFSVWGSADKIRDSSNSAPIGVWVENMREGSLTDFKVQHIVGSGLQIDKCIVSRIDGIVYRCGSNTKRAVDQTDSAQDGCQASFVRLSCEDGHGSLGAMKWLSHRNTHIEAKLENQPYHICEVTSPSGTAARTETVTFSGGATATVALQSPAPTVNTQGQLIVKEVTGTIAAAETFTTSGGASGTVAAVTSPNGPMFESAGDYGILDIFANQNELNPTGNDITLSKANAHTLVRNLAVRSKHYGVAISVTGSDYTFNRVFASLALTDVANHANYSYAMEFTSRNNHVLDFYSENSKGIHFGSSASRCKIDTFVQENLYGQSAFIEANDCSILEVDCAHASYVDPGIGYTHAVRITGDNSRFGVNGGRVSFSQTTSSDNTINLAGDNSFLGPIEIESAGNSNIAVFMNGDRATVNSPKVTVGAGLEGIRCASLDGSVLNPFVTGGGIGVDLQATGARLIGGTITNYSTRAVNAQPGSTVEAMRIQDVTCHTPNGTPAQDILVSANVTYSSLINNNARRGVGTITMGIGTGNKTTKNIV